MKFALYLVCAIVAEARLLKESAPISPALKPESHEQFVKDNAGDERPKVVTSGSDKLHFNHPYPVVQDSEDFDKDFVKDENADNGEWKAQSEYDKLRHKLTKLKKLQADALKAKNEEKKELEDAMQKYAAEMAADKANIAKKSNEVIKHEKEPVKPVEPAKPVKPVKPVQSAPTEPPKVIKKAEDYQKTWWSSPWGAPATTEAPTAKPTQAPAAAVDSTSDEQKAVDQSMKNLKDCEQELADAKAELKKLLDELAQANKEQQEATEALKKANSKVVEKTKIEEGLHTTYDSKAAAEKAATDKYDKQKAHVDDLRAKLKIASAKVQAMRDAEDKNGGVYPTPVKERSAAHSTATSHLLVVSSVVMTIWQVA